MANKNIVNFQWFIVICWYLSWFWTVYAIVLYIFIHLIIIFLDPKRNMIDNMVLLQLLHALLSPVIMLPASVWYLHIWLKKRTDHWIIALICVPVADMSGVWCSIWVKWCPSGQFQHGNCFPTKQILLFIVSGTYYRKLTFSLQDVFLAGCSNCAL